MAASKHKQKQLCCTAPQPRIDSPEPPPRPLASIDGIFAAAALPEDHPDALHFRGLKDKKPELDPDIVKSPGLADKLKMQWRKKSVKNLSKDNQYDSDAHVVTSQEVMEVYGALPGSERTCSDGSQEKQPLVVDVSLLGLSSDGTNGERSVSGGGSESKNEIRSSVLGSAEYLRPLFEK
jgi:hypothetical protein